MPFVPGDPDFDVHRIVVDDPTCPDVLVETDGGQRFILGRAFARAIVIPPSGSDRSIPVKIDLHSIEHSASASQETVCYTANLYVDGRRIGTVGNDGGGGCDTFHGDRAAYAAADAW